MKKNILVSAMLLLFTSITTNANGNKAFDNVIKVNKISQEKIITITLKVTGMTCAGCSIALQRELKNIEGVIENDVQYPGNIAIIKYDSSKTTLIELVKVFENKGYKAEVVKS